MMGIMCDNCSQWYHPICQDMRDNSYVFHSENPDFSWVCLRCGAPNHSVSVLENNLASFESTNSFNTLSDSTSRSSGSFAEQRTNSHRFRNATLNVLKLNARSIKAQDNLDQFHAMLDQISLSKYRDVYDYQLLQFVHLAYKEAGVLAVLLFYLLGENLF